MKKLATIGNCIGSSIFAAGMLHRLTIIAVAAITTSAAQGRDTGDSGFAGVPAYAEVGSVVAGGSGCRGRVKAELIGGELLRLDLGPITGEAGGGVPRNAFREFCQVNLEIDHPTGWTYTVELVHTNLKGYLTSGGRAEASLSYYFQGSSRTSTTTFKLNGPDHINDVVASTVDDQQFSPCHAQRSLNVKQSVIARASRSRGSLATLAIAAPTHLLLKWKRCR